MYGVGLMILRGIFLGVIICKGLIWGQEYLTMDINYESKYGIWNVPLISDVEIMDPYSGYKDFWYLFFAKFYQLILDISLSVNIKEFT